MTICRQSLLNLMRQRPVLRDVVRWSRATTPIPSRSPVHKRASYASQATPRDARREQALKTALEIENVDAAQKTFQDIMGDPGDWSMEKLHKRQVPSHLIPPSTLYYFSECMIQGILPDGSRSLLPRLRREERVLMVQPYNAWAPRPAPVSEATYSLQDKVSVVFNSEWISGIYLPIKVNVLKARLWHGMVPMTGARWKEKKLDDPKNFQEFHDYMMEIIGTIALLNTNQAQTVMRKGFNWLAQEYATFAEAINARREQRGIKERVDFRAMWAEYFRSLLSTMTSRTHQWLVDRVEEIQTKSRDEYEAALEAAGTDESAITQAGKIFFERVQDLNLAVSRVDFVLNVPMQGFDSYTPSTTGIQDLPLDVRKDAYYKLVDSKSWESYRAFQGKPEDRDHAYRNRDAVLKVYDEGRVNRAIVRRELRGQPQELGREHWVSILKSRHDKYLQMGETEHQQSWGFVCYRLWYRQTPDEWEEFKNRLEADLFKFGEWVDGAEDLRRFANLQWVDGEKLGIPEGDVEAAKKHFATIRDSEDFLPQQCLSDFLVVDQSSYLSYHQPATTATESTPPYGNSGGHVRLVDPGNYNKELLDATSPGFAGDFKILTSIVLDELYPLLTSVALRPKDLWPLARLHGKNMYVGPTVASQEVAWETGRAYLAGAIPRMFEWIKEKQKEARQDGKKDVPNVK